MDEKRDEKVAIVTGASKGIGRAISIELGKCAYYIVVNYRSDGYGASQTLEMINETGGNGEIRQFDVSNIDETVNAIEAICSRFENIEILINNAGIAADELFVMMTPDKWRSVIETSLNGFYNVTRPVLENMILQKKGSIVSISSVAGIMGNRGQANYSAAKAGLIGASRVVASEVARLGIRVNVVAPGLINTEMINDAPVANIKTLIPMARIGRPEEVAKVVKFLCSEDASYITGQVISVNGGMF
ncbi:MAG: 3-oxoacyl-ACP reductase FabG [Desulfobacterales bacterium]|nr:3-oxoacyl-ACP reductase FabG [Desulfobacterales bacterium]